MHVYIDQFAFSPVHYQVQLGLGLGLTLTLTLVQFCSRNIDAIVTWSRIRDTGDEAEIVHFPLPGWLSPEELTIDTLILCPVPFCSSHLKHH